MKPTHLYVAVCAALALAACTPSKSGAVQRSKEQAKTTQKDGATPSNKGKEQKMEVTELTAALFKQRVMDYEKHPNEWVFEGERPALIDFYATWCGPCKAVAPIVHNMAEKYAGKLDVYKVDVDKEQELAALFGIRSIPSLLFIPKSGQPKMQVGAMGQAQMEEAIEALLKE